MSKLGNMVNSVLVDMSGLQLRDAVRQVISQSRFYAVNNLIAPFLPWELDAVVEMVTTYISGDIYGQPILLSHERLSGSEINPDSLARSESLDWLLECTLSEASTAEDVGRYFVCLCYRYRYCDASSEPASYSYLIDLVQHINRLQMTGSESRAIHFDTQELLAKLNQIFHGIETGELLYRGDAN